TTKQAWKETKQTVKRANDGLVSARNKVGKAGLAVAGVANPAFGKAMKTARTVQGKVQGMVQEKANQNQAKKDFQQQAKATQAKNALSPASNQPAKDKKESTTRRTPQTLSIKDRLSLKGLSLPKLKSASQLISKVPFPIPMLKNKPHFQSRVSQLPALNIRSKAKVNRVPQTLGQKPTLKVSQVKQLQSLRQSKDKVQISVRNAQKPVQVSVNPKFKQQVHNKMNMNQKRTIQYKGLGGKHR